MSQSCASSSNSPREGLCWTALWPGHWLPHMDPTKLLVPDGFLSLSSLLFFLLHFNVPRSSPSWHYHLTPLALVFKLSSFSPLCVLNSFICPPQRFDCLHPPSLTLKYMTSQKPCALGMCWIFSSWCSLWCPHSPCHLLYLLSLVSFNPSSSWPLNAGVSAVLISPPLSFSSLHLNGCFSFYLLMLPRSVFSAQVSLFRAFFTHTVVRCTDVGKCVHVSINPGCLFHGLALRLSLGEEKERCFPRASD